MSTRINSEGYFLDANGKVKTTGQENHLAWKAKLEAAWAKNNTGAPPADQTIMVVEEGDCQWTIAEDAGADPVKTAYKLNEQFDNPDLINPNDIVFVDKTTTYEHTPKGADQKDNTDIFANQTKDHTSTAQSTLTGVPDVRNDISAYLDTIPKVDNITDPTIERPGLHYQAVHNLLYFPSWGDPSTKGYYGRQLIAEEYLRKFQVDPSPGSGMSRETAANELKVSLGLATKKVNDQGKVEYKDKTEDEIRAEKDNIAKEAGLQGDDLKDTTKVDNAVKDKISLLHDINKAYSSVSEKPS